MFTHTADLQLATDPRPFSSQCMFGFQIFLLGQRPLSIILSHLSTKREERCASCRRTIPNGLTLRWSMLTMRANSHSIIRASLSSALSATSFYSVFQPLQFHLQFQFRQRVSTDGCCQQGYFVSRNNIRKGSNQKGTSDCAHPKHDFQEPNALTARTIT